MCSLLEKVDLFCFSFISKVWKHCCVPRNEGVKNRSATLHGQPSSMRACSGLSEIEAGVVLFIRVPGWFGLPFAAPKAGA